MDKKKMQNTIDLKQKRMKELEYLMASLENVISNNPSDLDAKRVLRELEEEEDKLEEELDSLNIKNNEKKIK